MTAVFPLDAYLFGADCDEKRPQQIGELCRREQDHQRHPRDHPPGCEADREVPDEHGALTL